MDGEVLISDVARVIRERGNIYGHLNATAPLWRMFARLWFSSMLTDSSMCVSIGVVDGIEALLCIWMPDSQTYPDCDKMFTWLLVLEGDVEEIDGQFQCVSSTPALTLHICDHTIA
jgi:hypothetical protein